jgi:monoamine oxidase
MQRMQRIEADVCVVGAGYSGLTAAWRIHQAGRSVVVLEARDRVGGRVWTEERPDGTAYDRGGGWISPRHDAWRGLMNEFGISTYKTWMAGRHLIVTDDQIRPYKGLIPKIGITPLVTIALAAARLDRWAKKVPLDAPWEAPKAADWDRQSIADWWERSGVRTKAARGIFEVALRGMFTCDLSEASLLHLLLLVHSAGGWNSLTSIDGGYQDSLIAGGAGSAARAIAAALGDALHLRSPARRVAQSGDVVTIESDELSVVARHCVVSVPPALALEIDFDPALPPGRRTLYEQAVAGPETKTIVMYDDPFWREDGFSGQTAANGTAAEVTLDSSPSSGCGTIASFTFGPVADRMRKMDPTERRSAVLAELTKRFGDRASAPVAFVETSWIDEEWSRGCSMAHYAPGALTTYGHLLREPFGRVHWAGTETATVSHGAVSHGAVDGAVRSGERAASEILAAS